MRGPMDFFNEMDLKRGDATQPDPAQNRRALAERIVASLPGAYYHSVGERITIVERVLAEEGL